MNVAQLKTNNPVDVVLTDLEQIEAQIATLKQQGDAKRKELFDLLSNDMQEQLADKDYGCGTVNVDTDAFKVKVTVTKRVDWDGDALSDIAKAIAANGDNPLEYIKAKYTVAENAYKNWPEAIRKVFEPARTVKVSAPSLSFERKV